MENQETNQQEIYSTIVELPNYGEVKKDEKECKTCGNKNIGKGNAQLIVIGITIVFFTFYGLISLIKDIGSLFTR